MLALLWIIAVFASPLVLAYTRAAGWQWAPAAGLALAATWWTHALPPWLAGTLATLSAAFAVALVVPFLRRKLLSDRRLAPFRNALPPMSQTEREAIEAGTVWWDGELLSGRPNWQRLLDVPKATLSPDEQRFLDHEVDELCWRSIENWWPRSYASMISHPTWEPLTAYLLPKVQRTPWRAKSNSIR